MVECLFLFQCEFYMKPIDIDNVGTLGAHVRLWCTYYSWPCHFVVNSSLPTSEAVCCHGNPYRILHALLLPPIYYALNSACFCLLSKTNCLQVSLPTRNWWDSWLYISHYSLCARKKQSANRERKAHVLSKFPSAYQEMANSILHGVFVVWKAMLHSWYGSKNWPLGSKGVRKFWLSHCDHHCEPTWLIACGNDIMITTKSSISWSVRGIDTLPGAR